MKGEWIRKGTGGSVAVFIHGILSSGESCWTNKNGAYWPELLATETKLSGVGIYVFTYKTGFFSGSYRLGNVVDSLKEHFGLDGVLDDYNQIIFVCHSMGGIVARKYIVERAVELLELKKKIGLFLIASPSLGSKYATALGWLSALVGHSQADALRFAEDNTWLNDLDKEFQNLKSSGRLQIVGKELIEDVFPALSGVVQTQVVQFYSGQRYFGDPYKVPDADHFSIAKPEGVSVVQHRLLVKFIADSAKKLGLSLTVEDDAIPH